MVDKYILVVPSNPLDGLDDLYNHWYDDVHLADVCAIPGFTGAKRYRADAAWPNPTQTKYLAIYQLETDDPGTALAELVRRANEGEMDISPALDRKTARMTLYRVC